jgi:cutinase
MKFFALTTLLAATASALPTSNPAQELEARQLGRTTRDDLINGNSASCADVIFIYARGSTETGNLVRRICSHDNITFLTHPLGNSRS